MDQVTRTRKFLKKEEWKTLILECQSSGMTVASWCATNNVCQQTYYRNLQKLRAELCESFPIPVPAVLPEKPIEFKKLEVLTSIPNIQAAVIIHLPNASLEINNGASQQTVEAVLLALKNIC